MDRHYGLLVPVARTMTPKGAGEVRQILAAAAIRSATAPSAASRTGRHRRGDTAAALFPIQVLVLGEDEEKARYVLREQTTEPIVDARGAASEARWASRES